MRAHPDAPFPTRRSPADHEPLEILAVPSACGYTDSLGLDVRAARRGSCSKPNRRAHEGGCAPAEHPRVPQHRG